MAGCGVVMEVSIPSGYTYKTVKVKCGNTSPNGNPWLCEACEEKYAGVDWYKQAKLAGETWGEDDY